MQQVFAEKAWLGPGQFANNILVSFNDCITAVEHLTVNSPVPPGIPQVTWLTPGFINAHCHLEYSWMKELLPRGSIPFGEWMESIMTARSSADITEQSRQDAMTTAAIELVNGGCTMVWDSTTNGASGEVLSRSGIWHFLFHEVLGLTEERAQPILLAALDHMHHPAKPAFRIGDALNPHAPYSVGPWLRSQLRLLPDASITAWHLGESSDEEEFFQSGSGSIAEFYRTFGFPCPTDNSSGRSSLDFLLREGLLESCRIAFHGNHIADSSLDQFTAPRAVVHCPGTHQWFERAPLPLKQWLNRGVNVCLGTDSLASADSLSMLNAINIVASTHPDLSADQILTMACCNPLKCGIVTDSRFTGTIATGSSADLVALSCDMQSNDWANLFQRETLHVKQCWISGIPKLSQ